MAKVNLIAQVITKIFFLISFLDTEVQEQNRKGQNIYSDLQVIFALETSKIFTAENQGYNLLENDFTLWKNMDNHWDVWTYFFIYLFSNFPSE